MIPRVESEIRPEDIPLHHKQRIERGWSDFDWYSGDVFLARVIGEMAAKYRGRGRPFGLTEDQWDEILTKISEPLLEYAEKKFQLSLDEETRLGEKAQKALRLFAKYFPDFWD